MTKWIDFTRLGGQYMPFLKAYIEKDGQRIVNSPLLFLVDTGSVFSFAPLSSVVGGIDLSVVPKKDTGCVDANGGKVDGRPIKCVLSITELGLKIEETIYFREGDKQKLCILGHQAFLKSFNATFCSGIKNGILALKKFTPPGTSTSGPAAVLPPSQTRSAASS